MKDKDEHLRKINILETEGHHRVEGPQLENTDTIDLLITKQVNIGTEAEPNLAKIVEYWEDTTIDKVIELLCEY